MDGRNPLGGNMFVLDALRRLSNGKLTIPSFHLGHLGFRPGLEVDSQHIEFENRNGFELTLTPFQGNRENLFIVKCIFREQPGVVARALAAFARMRLNVLSLESATIDGDTKHVLFCILSRTREKKSIPVDESTKHKIVDLLPLLPLLDKRYYHFFEMLFLFCFDALEYESIPGREQRGIPKVSIKPFDDFYYEKNWRALKIRRKPMKTEPKDAQATLPSVYIDLLPIARDASPALLFSETETKALHIIFPKPGRAERFLHIGFIHQNRPGALLLLAELLQHSEFSIKTSLLRQHDIQRNVNVWETMLEYVGAAQIGPIPEGKPGVQWFVEWCFNSKNPNSPGTRGLISHLRAYSVSVCRPSYPRRAKDNDHEFEPIDLLSNAPTSRKSDVAHDDVFEVRSHQMAARLTTLKDATTGTAAYAWIAKLVYSSLNDMLDKNRGDVFVSIPGHCKNYLDSIEKRFKNELNLRVQSYIRGDAANNISSAALEKIRNSDFFLGVWHPEKQRNNELSPWMPYEFGAALALGKPFKLIAHRDVPTHMKLRIMRDYSLIEYDDDTFEDVITKLINSCKDDWPAARTWNQD